MLNLQLLTASPDMKADLLLPELVQSPLTRFLWTQLRPFKNRSITDANLQVMQTACTMPRVSCWSLLTAKQ
jgi:hypothetical protein